MKPIDMLFGNPTFLQEYRDNIYGKSSVHFSENEYMPYIRSNTYLPLVEQIKKTHRLVGNIEIADTDEIVIGVGATQVLFATLETVYGDRIWIESPYWFRFEKITEMLGINMCDYADDELLVLPNNPNNKVRLPNASLRTPAVDACYLWPYYFRKSDDYKTATEVLKAVAPQVTIFSLAKCTGHAASRIGWAIVKDKEVAKQMRSYIEYSTGGASIEAQVRAASVLQFSARDMESMAARLEDRWKMLEEQNFNNIKLLNITSGGMFLFGECTDPRFYDMLTAKNVLFMKGTQCGSHEGTFRANMGCDMETLERFIEVLQQIDKEIEYDQGN